MELPLGGPALRHYTQSRPRPHRQKLNHRPSRPQDPIIESENEALGHMGRVDEGVEEFFTKRVLPADALRNEDEISPVMAPESISATAPPPTKTLRRKLGDFFTLRKRRGLKTEASQEGRSKKASIADLIRPLREAARADKDKNRVKENDKENEKENEKEKRREKADGGAGDDVAAAEETPGPGAAPLRGDAAPPRRALREGKSQSLILLSGSAAPGTGGARHAKKNYEGQHSFEHKLSLMLQRIGVTKSQPAEEQNPEGEMKKADSEGTIIDNKPEPPPTFTKPRTMSTSSDTRHQIRQSASAHESAGKPALPPKPILKPAAQPPTSGRNTPENELAKIQEADASTPRKPGPPDPSASSPSSSHILSATAPLADPSVSASVLHPDGGAASPPAAAPSDAVACADSVESEATFRAEAASPALVDSGAAVSSTHSLSSSAAALPTRSTETLSPVPAPGAAAAVASASPLPPTAITIPITSSETLLALPVSSTSFESITLTPPSPSTATTTTSATTPSVTSSVSVSISESPASVMPPNPSTHAPHSPNGGVTNCTASASISHVNTTVDSASVVSAGIFQDAPRSPPPHSAGSMTHPDLISITDISSSSETSASPVVTPAHDLVNASYFYKTVLADPLPDAESTASPHDNTATPAAVSVSGPVSPDGANSVSPSPSIPSDTANTPRPDSSTSGPTDATRPSHTPTAPPATHSGNPASVDLPVTNDQGPTHLSSISTSEDTDVPSVTMPTAASPPGSTSPTRNSRAEVDDLQTPPEEKPGRDSAIKEKETGDDGDRNVQRSEQNERNGNGQEDGGGEHPDMEGEPAQSTAVRTVDKEPGPEARSQKDDQQNGTEGRPEA